MGGGLAGHLPRTTHRGPADAWRCSPPPVTRGCTSGPRSCRLAASVAVITDKAEVWARARGEGAPCTVVRPLWGAARRRLRNVPPESPRQPATPLLSIFPKKNKTESKDLHAPRSLQHRSQRPGHGDDLRPARALTGDWVRDRRCTSVTERCSATKRMERCHVRHHGWMSRAPCRGKRPHATAQSCTLSLTCGIQSESDQQRSKGGSQAQTAERRRAEGKGVWRAERGREEPR